MNARLRIAVLTTHDAVAQPANPEFAGLFARLGAMGELRGFGGDAAGPEALLQLEGCDALLIGGPLRPFGSAMIAGIRDAVARGCRLLILAHAGGDARPLGRDGARSALGALCDGLEFEDALLHYPSSMESYDNSYIELPAEKHGAKLAIVAGCSIAVAPGAAVLRRIGVAGWAGRNLRRDEVSPYLLTGDVSEVEDATVFVRIRQGEGTVTALSGAYSLGDERWTGDEPFPAALFALVVSEWLSDVELKRRQSGTQRHRLLHGYPMQPLGEITDGYERPKAGLHRQLIVGVLPHSYCNPAVAGCGFCAFPHEKLEKQGLEAVAGKVIAEIEALEAVKRPAAALYLGGATANLTPAPLLEALAGALAERFAPGEVTLEGVARYFQIDGYRCLQTLQDHFGASARRISMGVQTLDEARLRAMGRAGFGDRRTFAAVVAEAHARGMAASGDLLINLPGQPRAEMLRDMEEAIELGFDQICAYHLVLAPQLDVPWAKDASLLAALPKNEEACGNWLAVRERLLEAGFSQRTLTNFVRPGSPPFLYEEQGFIATEYDTLGFGPASITRVADASFRAGRKVERPTRAALYLEGKGNRSFVYSERDMQILFLTRGLARLRVDAPAFQRLFGLRLADAFPGEIAASEAAGLLDVAADGSLALTPRGMFYSDSIAGLAAWSRVAELRATPVQKGAGPRILDDALEWRKFRDPNDAAYGSMG